MQHDNDCYTKAVKRGQRTWTLIEQDVSAPRTILFWISENLLTAPDAKLWDAFEDLMAFKNSAITKKQAD